VRAQPDDLGPPTWRAWLESARTVRAWSGSITARSRRTHGLQAATQNATSRCWAVVAAASRAANPRTPTKVTDDRSTTRLVRCRAGRSWASRHLANAGSV